MKGIMRYIRKPELRIDTIERKYNEYIKTFMIDKLLSYLNLKKKKGGSYTWDIERDNGKYLQ